MANKRISFIYNGTLQVFNYDFTSNSKIAKLKENKKESVKMIVQSYSFSKGQFLAANNRNREKGMQSFFIHDSDVCKDCVFSYNQNNGKSGGCYTHKFNQFMGMLSSLRSIKNEFGKWENIPEYSPEILADIVQMSKGKYVRFGSYGEPSLHPVELVELVANVAELYTGYTHQWHRKPEYLKWFMASVHNIIQANTVKKRFNARSFLAVTENDNVQAVQCPASEESGYKSNCADCGLCSGTTGKGKKDVVILKH